MWLFRPLVSLVLGTAIFVAFLVFLVANSLTNQLLDASFYSRTLDHQDSYNRIYIRIYGEVLLDPEVREGVRSLLGDTELVDYEETAQLLRRIMPIWYVQEQVESALAHSIDYLKGEADTLELYIALGPPLGRVKGVLFQHIDQRIDALKQDGAAPVTCTPEGTQEVARRIRDLIRRLSEGKLPQSVPSLRALGQPCLDAVFEALFRDLMADGSLDQQTRQALGERREELQHVFLGGDIHGLLKQVARTLTGPSVDDAVAQVRKGLDDQARLDIISKIADWHGQITAGELRDAVGGFRDGVDGFPFFRQPALALTVVVGGSLIMGLVHLPRLAAAVRWPGLTLILTGGVCYAAAKVAQATLPSRLADLLAGGAAPISPIPPSAIDLGGDILQSLSQQVFTGLAGPSLVLLLVGAVLFASSFAIAAIRPLLPGLR